MIYLNRSNLKKWAQFYPSGAGSMKHTFPTVFGEKDMMLPMQNINHPFRISRGTESESEFCIMPLRLVKVYLNVWDLFHSVFWNNQIGCWGHSICQKNGKSTIFFISNSISTSSFSLSTFHFQFLLLKIASSPSVEFASQKSIPYLLFL